MTIPEPRVSTVSSEDDFTQPSLSYSHPLPSRRQVSLLQWHALQNDDVAVKNLLQEDHLLVHARDYDLRTPLHVAATHGSIDVAKSLLEHNADVNAQDRLKNTPLANAEGANKPQMIEFLKSYGGISYGSHFVAAPPLPNKFDWEVDPYELDLSGSIRLEEGSRTDILKASWRGTPVAVKGIRSQLSDDRLVIAEFRHEINLHAKLRHPNIVQFMGAVTERKPLLLITEYLRGGDLHQHLKEKGALAPLTAIKFALDIARGMVYLHDEPNVVIHRDLNPSNVFLVHTNANHLKVGDFGLSMLSRVQHSGDHVYVMTGKTGSYRYMAPEVFKHQPYNEKVDVFSFAMILYEMLEGEPPLSSYEPYEAARFVAEGHRPMLRAKGFVPELRNLIKQCWAAGMDQRPSFLEILMKLEEIKEYHDH